MVFHSASAEVWNALQRAYQDAGFDVEYAGVLDKKQGSFKQVTTEGAVRGDPVLLLGPRRKAEARIESKTGADECVRSEEHTSELQSLMRISYAVFCLKKKNRKTEVIDKSATEYEA